jgi:hypothetical protein
VAEIEADEVGASLKFATAKVERATDRGPSDRSQGRDRQAERGDFTTSRRLIESAVGALGLQPVGFQGAGRSLHNPRCHSRSGLAREWLCGPAGTRPGVAPQRLCLSSGGWLVSVLVGQDAPVDDVG